MTDVRDPTTGVATEGPAPGAPASPSATGPSLARRLKATYLTLDARSLGLGRICLALALLIDLGRRVPVLGTWYTNDGLLPNHTLLWQPTYDHALSLFYLASYDYEAAIGFALCAVVYVMLLLGWRTRLAQVASLVAVLSLHGRVLFVQNGGDVVLSELALFTAFLPTGRRFSIDALRAGRGPGHGREKSDVTSLACLALLLQLAAIYFFNAVQKTGESWVNGAVVHYVLQLDGRVTHLGAWLRPHVTMGGSRVFTRATLYLERAAPLLILSPIAAPPMRTVAVVALLGLHLGFALLLNLGMFSLSMMVFLPHILPGQVWDMLGEQAVVRRSTVRLAAVADRLDAALARVEEALAGMTGAAVRFVTAGGAVWTRRRVALREGAVAVLLLVALSQMAVENFIVPPPLRQLQPRWAHVVVNYLQLFEGWLMFAPEPFRGDRTIAVDAVTEDGRHVDPFNEEASPGTPPFTRDIPARLGYSSFVNAYTDRLPDMDAYYPALSDWILRYPDRTGDKRDAIKSFTVSLLENTSPPPGEQGQRDPRVTVLFVYPR